MCSGATTQSPEGLPARLPSPPWEGRSALGVLVRLTAECNQYRDAQPFYTVAYGLRAGGRAQVVRHTPTQDRAHALLRWFLRDVTDPARLVTDPPASGARPTARARDLTRWLVSA